MSKPKYQNIYVVFDGVKDVEFTTRAAARYYAFEVCGDPRMYRIVKRLVERKEPLSKWLKDATRQRHCM